MCGKLLCCCHTCSSDQSSEYQPSMGAPSPLRSMAWNYSPSALSRTLSTGTDRLLTPLIEVQRKIVVLGFRGVGKSALAIQFAEGRFVEVYEPTIENTFRTTIRLNKVRFVCDILDTAGQDEYSSISRQASVGVHGYLLVFSITSRNSFEAVKMIHDKLLSSIGAETVPSVLIAAKCDMQQYREVSREEGQALARHWGCPYVECSSRQNWKVEEVFVTLISHIERGSGLLATETIEKCNIL